MFMERKALDATAEVEVEVDVDKRIIRGYAAIFDNVDLVDDVILKGAFAKSIAEKFAGRDGTSDIKTLYDHHQPIGLPVSIVEDDKGLLTEARLSKTRDNDDLLELIRDRVIDKMSIGFVVTKSAEEERDGRVIRLIQEVDLFEFGPVLWAANTETSVDVVKSIRAVNRQLKAGGVSATEAARLADMLLLLHEALTAHSQEGGGDGQEKPEEPGEKSQAHLMELKGELSGFLGQLKTLNEHTNGVL